MLREDAVTLLTLEMGPILMKVYDWKCNVCHKKNFYTGRHDGIFPTRKSVAYSTDYLYCLVDLVCRLSISQRTAYESLNVISKQTKKLLQLEFSEVTTENVRKKLRDLLQRRRVNEALGLFFQTLNYGSTNSMKLLYKCDRCETCLSDTDKRILGIPATEGAGLRRYKGLVIDGTSCGILSELPDYHRDNTRLTAPENTGRKFLITSKKEKRILRVVFELANKHIRAYMKCPSRTPKHFFLQQTKGGLESRDMQFMRLLFRTFQCGCSHSGSPETRTLPANDDKHSEQCPYSVFSRNERFAVLSENLRNVFRLVMRENDNPPTPDSGSDNNSEEDDSRDPAFVSAGEQSDAVTAPAQQSQAPIDGEGQTSAQHDQSSPNTNASNQGNSQGSQQQNSSVARGTGRRRGRPKGSTARGVSRGRGRGRGRGAGTPSPSQHLPPTTPAAVTTDGSGQEPERGGRRRGRPRLSESGISRGAAVTATGSSASGSRGTARRGRPRSTGPRGPGRPRSTGPGRGAARGRRGRPPSSTRGGPGSYLALEFFVDNPSKCGQLLQWFLKFVSLYTREHLSLPYMSPHDPGPDIGPPDIDPRENVCGQQFDDLVNDAVNQRSTSETEGGTANDDYCNTYSEQRFIRSGRFNMRSEILSRPWMYEYDGLRQTMLQFAGCDHAPSDTCICNRCRKSMEPAYTRIRSANPVLYKFCEELSIERGLSATTCRAMALSAEKLIRVHMKEARAFFRAMDNMMPEDCYKYWSDFGSVSPVALDEDPDSVSCAFSGFIFPCAAKYRNHLIFDKTENFDCNKQYVRSKRFSPGILTVQCCCDKPQLLGYIIMVRAESTALALTSVLTHFQVPPRVVYYDNACNLAKSVLTRAPWLLHCTKFVVDRFHFKNHTCSELYDPDSYFAMDLDRTTTAESFNARLEKSVPYLRFVKADNLIPHLSIRFALLNVATRFRRKYRVQDLEDKDIWEFFKDTVPCQCNGCSNDAVTAIETRRVSEYDPPPAHAPPPANVPPPHNDNIVESEPVHIAESSSSEDKEDVYIATDQHHVDDDSTGGPHLQAELVSDGEEVEHVQ